MFSDNQRNTLWLVGRILLCSIFLFSMISKITGFEHTTQMMASKGLPLPSLLLVGAIAAELAGGLSLLTGYKMKWGALLLILYLIPTTLIFHNFWAMEGQQFRQQLISFLKNIAIMGGLFILTSAPFAHFQNRTSQ